MKRSEKRSEKRHEIISKKQTNKNKDILSWSAQMTSSIMLLPDAFNIKIESINIFPLLKCAQDVFFFLKIQKIWYLNCLLF